MMQAVIIFRQSSIKFLSCRPCKSGPLILLEASEHIPCVLDLWLEAILSLNLKSFMAVRELKFYLHIFIIKIVN